MVGIQAHKENNFLSLFTEINNVNTQIQCIAERNILKIINANCNSPISVVASILKNEIQIKVQLLDHLGEMIFVKTYRDVKDKYEELSATIGNEIIREVGEKQIEQLNNLANDFDYTP